MCVNLKSVQPSEFPLCVRLSLAIIIFIDICFNIGFPRMNTEEKNGLKCMELVIVTILIIYVVIIFQKKTIGQDERDI